MKRTKVSSISISSILLYFILNPSGAAADRIWTNRGEDTGTVHSLGNGKMVVYETGPQITTLYPGPYTSPPLYKMFIEDEKLLTVCSERDPGTAIWTHSMKSEQVIRGKITDFVDANIPCMVRHLELIEGIRLRLELIPGLQVLYESSEKSGNLMIRMDPGQTIYQYYVYPKPLYHQIYWNGNVIVEISDEYPDVCYLNVLPGVTDLFLVGGPEYPEVMEYAARAEKIGYKGLLDRTRDWWEAFSGARFEFESIFPANLPKREKLLQIIDEVSVMIRTQQATEGAVMAGYPYPLGYVRDQYGVSRGYLSLA